MRFFIVVLGASCALLSSCSRSPQKREAVFLSNGQKHLQARDFERAIIDFRNAVQVMPKDAEPHYQLGLAYLSAGNAQAGARELMNAIKFNPGHVGAQLKVAELMAGSSDPGVVKQGQEKAQEVLANSPNNADALRTLAMTELRLDDSGDAVQHLEQSLAAAPQDLKSSFALAVVKLRANDAAGAEQVLLKGAADAPKSIDHALILGRFYQLVRKPAEAEKQFRRALEIDPSSGPALAALGNLLYANGKTGEAEQMFLRASNLSDKRYRALHAIFLFQTGKGDAALHELDQQYQADKQDRATRTRLLVAYLKLGKNAEAQNVLNDALKHNPKDSDALMQRGEMRLMAGDYQNAQSDLTEVLRTRADAPQAHLVLARIHRARGASQSEIHELNETLRLNPRLLVARLELADAFTRSNSPKSALETLDQAPPRDHQNINVIIQRNTALYSLGNYAQVQEGIDQGLAIARDPRLLLQDGLLKLKQKNYRESRASLEEELKLQPQDWRAVEALSEGYLEEKNKDKAMEVARDFTSRVPNSPGAQQFLGSWLLRNGDVPGARTAFENSKRLDPKSDGASFGLVQIATSQGRLDEARGLLNEIVNREPRNARALISLGEIEDKAGHSTAAVSYYDRVLQEDSNNVAALNNLAYILADSRTDPDRALALAQKAKELVPENAAIDDTIGWAYYNKGLFQASLDYLAKAANGGTPRRKCHLAMAYIKLGNRQQAAILLQAAMKEDPSSPDAQKAMQLLAQAR
jgi:tetratricopeptide (TPR) repeat protein